MAPLEEEEDVDGEEEEAQLVRRHPLGVYPLGNALLDAGAAKRRVCGLGHLARLADGDILSVLRVLPPASCARLANASATLRAYAWHDELWREHSLALLDSGGRITWSEDGTWRATYAQSCPAARASSASGTGRRTKLSTEHPVYSDVLHRGYFYAAAELDPSWLLGETLTRVDARTLSAEAFVRDFERPSRPVLLEHCVDDWPAMKQWTKEHLLERFGDVRCACGAAELELREYYAYAGNNLDDTPLFVFDRNFQNRASALLQDYEVPEVFRGRDLFDLLGKSRPENRWLLIGNRKSGSKWHVDPNKTCAWNAVVRGRKRWWLLPPGCPPPGVHPSADGAEVTQPISLLEWFSQFFKQMKAYAAKNPAWELKEATCGPGECVFVPCGWWHCVLNIDDDTIAVTQNYCSETHVHVVRRFFHEKPEQVSGVSTAAEKAAIGELFDKALSQARPDLLSASGAAAVPEPAPPREPGGTAREEEKCGSFSFWDHLRSTGKPLHFVASRGGTDADGGAPEAKRARAC